MIDKNFNYYQIKRPFCKAQYHQCIPNPEKQGELITVQLIMPNIKQADPNHTLSEIEEPTKHYINFRVNGDDVDDRGLSRKLGGTLGRIVTETKEYENS